MATPEEANISMSPWLCWCGMLIITPNEQCYAVRWHMKAYRVSMCMCAHLCVCVYDKDGLGRADQSLRNKEEFIVTSGVGGRRQSHALYDLPCVLFSVVMGASHKA